MEFIISLLFAIGRHGAAAIFLASTLFFLALYLFSVSTSLVFTRMLLPRLGIGALIDPRKVSKEQYWFEIRHSLVSVIVFGLHGLFLFLLYRQGFISIAWSGSTSRITGELLVLFFWNEIHFYSCHRLLHTRWLMTHVHRVHHRSLTPTPFSTFSFHWFEALLLGTVMLLPLLLTELTFHALFFLPLVSIFGNSIGHCNYTLFPEKVGTPSRVHREHHARSKGNFGFLLPLCDNLFGTTLRRSGD